MLSLDALWSIYSRYRLGLEAGKNYETIEGV